MEDNKKTLIANIDNYPEPEDNAAIGEAGETIVVPEKAEEKTVIAESAVDSHTEDAQLSRSTRVIDKAGLAEEQGAEGNAAKQDKADNTDDGSADISDEEDGKQYGLPEDHHEIGELKERIEKRKKEKKKKQRRFRTWVYVTAASLMVIVFGFFFSISGFFTVDSIEVEGNSHYTNEEIINISHAVPGRNLIYNTNKSEMVTYLEQNPYIKSAKIKRKLPSTILIVVSERSERMAFKYDDDYLVMDGEGVLLKKTRNQPQTTLVEGLIVNKIKLGEKIGTEERDKTDKAIDIIGSMIKADLYFVKLDVSDMKKVKAYVYDNLVVKADYNTLMTNMDNGHLHLVLESLFKDGIKRGTITFEEDGSASFMPII